MIRIAAAYKDLLNLYGDYANLTVLVRYLRESGFLVETDELSVGSYINLKSVDLLYLGAGTERRMLLALNDFKRFFRELRDFTEKGGFILATGSAAALLGNTVVDYNGDIHTGAGLLDMDITLIKRRVYSDLILSTPFSEDPAVGVINSSMVVISREKPMFNIDKDSSRKNRKTEGAYKNTVFATELSGPLLVRNPSLLHFFAEQVSDKKIPVSQELWVDNSREGYRRVLENLRHEMKGSLWQR